MFSRIREHNKEVVHMMSSVCRMTLAETLVVARTVATTHLVTNPSTNQSA
jgi:hypothetical protein